MNGCVLDNEQILCLAESSRSQDVHDLIATIRDRDKMIVELRESVSTLRNYADHSMFCEYRSLGECDCGYAEVIKTLTVSKKEESKCKNELAKEVEADMRWREARTS